MHIDVIDDSARVADEQRSVLFELIEFYESEAKRSISEIRELKESAERLVAERDSLSATCDEYAAQLERIRSIPAIRLVRRIRRGFRELVGR